MYCIFENTFLKWYKFMKQKMFLTAAALVLLFLSACPTRAGEITIDWRQKLDSGKISDLKFMPGQNTFIHNTGYETQIRNCEDGEVIAKYPIIATQYEFTPDSSKLVMLNGFHAIQIRNLSDMSLVNEIERTVDTNGYYVSFQHILVDPVRPFIYALWKKTKGIHSTLEDYRKIQIYDRENLQLIGELTTEADTNLGFTNIAVSKDGKYLAAMNYGVSKLNVWSLDTRQKVVEKYISDQNSDKFSEPADIKFSEQNSDKVFFTGKFYQREGKERLEGLCIFSINENRIIDSTFALIPNNFGWNPEICFFENELKVIGTSDGFVKVLDLSSAKVEINKDITSLSGIGAYSNIFNEYFRYFIGISGSRINKYTYQPNTSVPTENPKETIYPNPTSGIVNIPMNCANASKYEIYNTTGRLLNSTEITSNSNNLLEIDFTLYPAGVYSVKVYCGKTVEQYQVVRGE